MYVAKQHSMSEATALGVARSIGVGQLVSVGDGTLNATFVPFNIVNRDGLIVLQAHLNRVNTQWKDVGEAMMIVQGPSAHVAGTDFPAERREQKLPTVPTLNYVTVHLRGTLSFHDDDEWKRSHLTSLVDQFEGEWRIGTHSSYELVNNALVALVGVELEVSDVIGKAKLGQNMSPADLQYTAQHLRERDPDGSSVADLMEEIALPWAEDRAKRIDDARGDRKPLSIAGGLAE